MRNTVENDWTTKAGLRAICILTGMGHRCGYVGIPKGHPLYGVEYHEHSDALREAMERIGNDPIGKRGVVPLFCHKSGECPPDVVFDVHGGITYSGGGDGYPADGDEWWFGFDCAHAGDATGSSLFPGGVLRTREYVESECESLAEQLAMIIEESPVERLRDAAHKLAMYVLQSEAYQKDMDTRDAVDGVLALVMPRKAGE